MNQGVKSSKESATTSSQGICSCNWQSTATGRNLNWMNDAMINYCSSKRLLFFWFTSVINPCRMLGEQNKKFTNRQTEVSDLQNFLKWSQLQAKAPNQMESKLKRFFVTLAGNGNLLFIGLTLFASILDSFSRDAF